MRPRYSIAGLLVLIAYLALGCAALKAATESWACVLFTATWAALIFALLGGLFARGPSRAFWGGFFLVGSLHLVGVYGPWFKDLVGEYLIFKYWHRLLHAAIADWPYNEMVPSDIRTGESVFRYDHFRRVSHSMLSVVLGTIGGRTAEYFATRSRRGHSQVQRGDAAPHSTIPISSVGNTSGGESSCRPDEDLPR